MLVLQQDERSRALFERVYLEDDKPLDDRQTSVRAKQLRASLDRHYGNAPARAKSQGFDAILAGHSAQEMESSPDNHPRKIRAAWRYAASANATAAQSFEFHGRPDLADQHRAIGQAQLRIADAMTNKHNLPDSD
jgi:thioredoxin-like negative regulator of GroEL